MGLLATYARDRRAQEGLSELLAPFHQLAGSPRWDGFERLVLTRPVTAGLLDLDELAGLADLEPRLKRLHRRFPSLGLLLIGGRSPDPMLLFRLGRLGLPGLEFHQRQEGRAALLRKVATACRQGTTAVVTRAVGPYFPGPERQLLRRALDEIHLRRNADEFAEECGFCRPFLSERLKQAGLPPVGHLLLWARLLHAGRWLPEPGRTGQSVSRQLEYANGSIFRRALRTHLEATPTQVVERGGLSFVLSRFLRECGVEATGTGRIISVA